VHGFRVLLVLRFNSCVLLRSSLRLPTGISIENGGGFLLDNGKFHEEALVMAAEDMRLDSFMDDLRSDAQSVSSSYPMQRSST